MLDQARSIGVRAIALDDPATRNSLTLDRLRQISRELDECAANQSTRVVLITGTGPTFCSGANRAELADPANAGSIALAVGNVLQQLDELSVPVVCKVNGDAYGAGLALLAAADIIIAVDTAHFALPEARMGFVATAAAASCMRRIGAGAALDLFLSGRRFTAEEGSRIGLLTSVVPSDELDAAVEEVLGNLMLGNIQALVATKQMLRRFAGLSIVNNLAFFDQVARDHGLA